MSEQPNGTPAPQSVAQTPGPYIKITPRSSGGVWVESNIASWGAIAKMLMAGVDVAVSERTRREIEQQQKQTVVTPPLMFPNGPFKV